MTSTIFKKLDKIHLKGGHRVMHIFMEIEDAKMSHVFAWGRFNKIDKLEVQDMGMKLLKRAMLCSTQRIYLSVCSNDDELASFCIQNSRTNVICYVCICIDSLCLYIRREMKENKIKKKSLTELFEFLSYRFLFEYLESIWLK